MFLLVLFPLSLLWLRIAIIVCLTFEISPVDQWLFVLKNIKVFKRFSGHWQISFTVSYSLIWHDSSELILSFFFFIFGFCLLKRMCNLTSESPILLETTHIQTADMVYKHWSLFFYIVNIVLFFVFFTGIHNLLQKTHTKNTISNHAFYFKYFIDFFMLLYIEMQPWTTPWLLVI